VLSLPSSKLLSAALPVVASFAVQRRLQTVDVRDRMVMAVVGNRGADGDITCAIERGGTGQGLPPAQLCARSAI